MIKSKIKGSVYKDHLGSSLVFGDTVYLVDYSDSKTPKLGVKFLNAKPNDIGAFELINKKNLSICCLRYTNKSFTRNVNGLRIFCSQCEGAMFPDQSSGDSWLLFAELKYCQENNNDSHINKARRQLYKTRYYYKSENILSPSNICYLIISLPTQSTPYSHTGFAPSYLLQLKSKHNIVMRATGGVEVLNDQMLYVE